MGWKERFRQGSFRGVSFLIDSADSEFGRRVAEHEFPLQDVPFSEDMGRMMRKFTVECFVLGDDYMTQKDNLIVAAEKAGPGLLVHSYYGNMNVVCNKLKIRDSKDETRIARLQFSFSETGELKFPTAKPDTVAKINASALTAFQKLQAAFQKSYDISKIPYKAVQSVQTQLSLLTTAVQDARQDISQVANFVQSIKNTAQTMLALAGSPLDLAQELWDALSFGILDPTMVDYTPDRSLSFLKMQNLFSFDPTLSAPSSASVAVSAMAQTMAVVVAGAIVPLIQYKSSNDAFETRDMVFDQIDTLSLGVSLDDDTFVALQDLRTAIQTHIETVTVVLPTLTTISIPQVTPAMLVSNDLYGDVLSEDDILNRNGIHHPGFVPSGVALKVLTK